MENGRGDEVGKRHKGTLEKTDPSESLVKSRAMDIKIPAAGNASRRKTELFYCVCSHTRPPSLYL